MNTSDQFVWFYYSVKIKKKNWRWKFGVEIVGQRYENRQKRNRIKKRWTVSLKNTGGLKKKWKKRGKFFHSD